MEFTAAAQWINNSFAGFDSLILGFMNSLANSAGDFLTPFMKLLSLLGEKGIATFLLAFILMLFPKTRKVGVCVFGAVCCGALITNIVLKDMVARPRPFESMASFQSYWKAVGSPAEDGFSFPSGHVTALTAGMAALCFCKGKKFLIPTIPAVLLMAISRCYLMAHFPSDVLAAMLVGTFSAFVAWLIADFMFNYFEDNDDLPFFHFLVYFDPLSKIPGIGGLFAGRSKKADSPRAAKASARKGSGRHGADGAGRARASSAGGIGAKFSALINGKRSTKSSGKHSAPTVSKGGKHSAPAVKPVADGEAPAAPAPEAPERSGKHAAEGSSGSTEVLNGAMSALKNIKLPSRPKRETSDWNERWNEYRSRKPAGSTPPSAPEPISFSFDDFVSDEPAKAKNNEAAPAVQPPVQGDEDMKIVPGKAPADVDMKVVPNKSVPAAPIAEDIPENGDITLPDVELHDIIADKITEMLPEEPLHTEPAAPQSTKRNSYRGKHER